MSEKIYLHSIPSTSDYLRENRDRYEDFSFVYADIQTAGHGRVGRTWLSEPNANLMFSLLIKNPIILAQGPKCTLVAATSVARCIEDLGIQGVSIKWPNDIYIGDKKAVGILLEGSLPEYMIIGIGINVNQMRFEGEYRIPPTSLALEAGKRIDLDAFRETVFASLERDFAAIPASFDTKLAYFTAHDYLYGKRVSVDGKGSYIASGVNKEFALILRDGENILYNQSGEIRILENNE